MQARKQDNQNYETSNYLNQSPNTLNADEHYSCVDKQKMRALLLGTGAVCLLIGFYGGYYYKDSIEPRVKFETTDLQQFPNTENKK